MKDILLDENKDLKIDANGDFAVGESDNQNIELIIESFMGEFKQFPALGFGIEKKIKSDTSINDILRDLKVQLGYDNYSDVNIEIDKINGQLKIDANGEI